MKALVILPTALALAACHVTKEPDTAPETAQACAARFAGLNNGSFRGSTPTYSFDLSAAKPTDDAEARLEKLVKRGTNVAVTVHKGTGPSLMQIEGEAVANAAQAVARGCAMEGRGVKFVRLELAIPDSPKQST